MGYRLYSFLAELQIVTRLQFGKTDVKCDFSLPWDKSTLYWRNTACTCGINRQIQQYPIIHDLTAKLPKERRGKTKFS